MISAVPPFHDSIFLGFGSFSTVPPFHYSTVLSFRLLGSLWERPWTRANPGGERPREEYSKMAAVLCGLISDSLSAKTVSECFVA